MAAIATGLAASTIALAGSAALAISAGRASAVRHQEWWIAPLGVRRAWTASKGAGQVVAVLSDGVVGSQVDLQGSVIKGPDFTGTGQTGGPFFGQMGTPIASIIAGHGHASSGATGMEGIAPLAQILSIRVTLPPGDPKLSQHAIASGLPDAIGRGIMYAVRKGATVIDLPLDPSQPGVGGTGGAAAAAGGSQAEANAVSYALAHQVVLIAPAGDNGAGTDAKNYPAAYPGVIAVGAFGPGFVKTPWTSGQSYVSVTAAGQNMISASNTNGYHVVNTTSAASAVVAGIAALIRSSFPELSADQVRSAIIHGTVFRHRNGLSNGSGYGAINAERALTAAAGEVPAADRAGAGSLPWLTQSAPSAVAAPHSNSIARQIIDAAIISAALLVLLLVLIGFYAGATRRRAARKQHAVAAEWSGRPHPSRYPQATAAGAEQMAEYFAAPASRSAMGGGAAAASSPGFAPSTRRDPVVAQPAASAGGLGAFSAGGIGGSSPWADSEPVARSPLGPASRAISRRPAVSGAPPWEAASQPHGQAPWVATPQQDDSTGVARQVTAAPREAGGLNWTGESLASPATPSSSTPGVPPMRLAASGPLSSRAVPPAGGVPGWDAAPVSGGHSPAPPGATAASLNAGSAGLTPEVQPGRSEWSQSQPGRHSAPSAPDQAQSLGGPLPVRQPGQTVRPNSPSGSLWERAVDPAPSPEGGSRPMGPWQPDAATDDAEGGPESPPWRPDWRVPEWTEGSGSGS